MANNIPRPSKAQLEAAEQAQMKHKQSAYLLEPARRLMANLPSNGFVDESLKRAVEAMISFPVADERMREVLGSISNRALRQIDLSALALPKIDVEIWFRRLPPNLRTHLDRLEDVAAAALKLGVPFAWVLPSDLVIEISDRKVAPAETIQRLLDNRILILDHIEDELAQRSEVWPIGARQALAAARDGHVEAAQSHAAGLVDSIVLDRFCAPGRQKRTGEARNAATQRAVVATSLDEQTLNELTEHVAIRPLVTAFAKWYQGDDPPESFNRHATAHCVGHTGVFSAAHSLVAVMLAASLAIQFSTQVDISTSA